MRKPADTKEAQLLQKLIRGGRTNLSEWFEKIADDFCEEQGAGHIVEPRPLLRAPPSNTNWAEKQKQWEKFIAEREWEYFLSK